MAGGIYLYRQGIDEFYLSQYSWIYEQLEAVRQKIEALGMYERCRDALQQVEAWLQCGTEHDDEAQDLLLKVGGELARASGSFESMQRRFRAANDAGN